ncbi:MAG: hypothetical protein M0Z70_11750 [Nitrospiraceae bacterium]|jgi:hypothetical protein|nr:hypothetical protein [Nitrospiraceae bacterium]
MINLVVKIPREDAEKAFQTGWNDEQFKQVAEELLHDLTQQMSDETQKAQEELGGKVEAMKGRKFVEALFRFNTLGTIRIDLVEKLKEIDMVFEDKIEFFDDYLIYSVFIYNAADFADYRRLNLKELQDAEKSLPWAMRIQLRAAGGLRAFLENIFKSQQKMAAIYKEELEAQFPHAKIDIAVNRTLKEE